MSKKETNILPKTVEFINCDTTISFADGEEATSLLMKIPYRETKSNNLQESIPKKMYPT